MEVWNLSAEQLSPSVLYLQSCMDIKFFFRLSTQYNNFMNYINKACKWVATLPLGDISTEAWSSGMGVGRGANNLTL